MKEKITGGEKRRREYQAIIKRLTERGWSISDTTKKLATEQDRDTGLDTLWDRPVPRWKALYYKFYRGFLEVFSYRLFNPRWYRRFYYRIRHGFDPADTWSLDWTLSEWLIPRLKYLKEHKHGIPTMMFDKPFKDSHTDAEMEQAEARWNEVLDEIIWAFEFYVDDDRTYAGDKEWKRWEEGMQLFVKHFQSLWD